jgi:serine phosphatase RsbU (regulator of sigma subunit)
LRNLLRAFAWDHDEPPAALLARLDRALCELGIDTLASAVLAVVEAKPTNSLLRLRWANAGHPNPVVLEPGTPPRFLTGAGGLLLGVDPATARSDDEVELRAGTTVVFYTDGLVESRGADVSVRSAQLLDLVSRFAAAPLDELLDCLIAELAGADREDDVAVLGARLMRAN